MNCFGGLFDVGRKLSITIRRERENLDGSKVLVKVYDSEK